MKRGSYFTLRISISISQWYWNQVAVWEVQSLNLLFCHSPRTFLHFPLILYIFCCHYFTLIPFTLVLSFAKKNNKIVEPSKPATNTMAPPSNASPPDHYRPTSLRLLGLPSHSAWPAPWAVAKELVQSADTMGGRSEGHGEELAHDVWARLDIHS